MGPPPGWVGGWVPWHVEMARDSKVYAVLIEVVAYPTGVEFSIMTRRAPDAARSQDGRPMGLAFRMSGPDAPRLGIGYPDGRKAVLEAMRAPSPSGEEPDRPILILRRGGGGRDEWRQGFWLWPLPPPGPLLVVTSGGQTDPGEHSVRLDAAELVAAAERAEQLWEIDPNERWRGGQWSSSSGTAMRIEAPRNDPLGRPEERSDG